MRSEKLMMPPVTVPFKWLVGVCALSVGAWAALITIGIWVGSTSSQVQAHDRDIIRLRDNSKDVITKVSRIEGILEVAFPKAAEKVPSVPLDN